MSIAATLYSVPHHEMTSSWRARIAGISNFQAKKKYNKQNKWLIENKNKTKIIQKVLLYVKKTGYHLECFCLVTSTYFIFYCLLHRLLFRHGII